MADGSATPRSEREIIADFLATMAGRIDAPTLKITDDISIMPSGHFLDLIIGRDDASAQLKSNECRRLAGFLDAAADALDLRENATLSMRKLGG